MVELLWSNGGTIRPVFGLQAQYFVSAQWSLAVAITSTPRYTPPFAGVSCRGQLQWGHAL